MEKQKICWIRVAKNVSYLLAPILLTILILSVLSILYVHETGIVQEKDNYYESSQFVDNYWRYVENRVNDIDHLIELKKLEIEENKRTEADKQAKEKVGDKQTEDAELEESYYTQYNGYYYEGEINDNEKEFTGYYQRTSNNFIYFIIDEKGNQIFCNMPYDMSHTTLESMKEEILSNKRYWIFENGKIHTTIEQLSETNVKYSDSYEKYMKDDQYTIYTAVRDELPYFDDILGSYILFSVAKNQYNNAIFIIPLILVLLVMMLCIILIGIGKTREGIFLSWFDKIPIEIAIALIGVVTFCICGVVFSIGVNVTAIVSIISIILGLIAIYVGCILLLETIVKRLKTHTFIKTTLGYWFYQKMKLIFSHMTLSLKIGAIFAGYVIIRAIILSISGNQRFLAFIQMGALYVFGFFYLLKRATSHEKIHQAIEQIYKGNTNVKLNEEEYKGDLKKVAIQVNDIAGGLSNAIDEKMKSERLKTELITNVSHDIKTPLTSIINYVDLLKKEDITTEKAAEYLAILDNKSQRLKKLTEDLVEASKASSGNLKMNMERLEVNELIKQVSAEFEEKFKLHQLEEIISYTKQPIYISADSRYMYRVLENMYSNISKYAMDNTRVYTDIIEHGNNVIIQMKNISKQKLNISADELMQRFVRGDTSRNTEGSGLGLSIANSLVELQNGQFHIYLDGDLFKVTIGFKKLKDEAKETAKEHSDEKFDIK